MYLLARAASILTARYGSKRLCSLNGLYSLNNLSGLNDLNSLISLIKLLTIMGGSFLVPKLSKPVRFCGMDHQKSNFLLILTPFLSEAVEDSQCYFFEN